MPRLTQIKETKKGRLALFFDSEFAFSLDENTFADAGLHQDDDLEEWQIEELRKKSETRRALDKAMDYLALRDHAAGELYQKLCRKFDAHSAAYAVARAGELGLLNDAGFARRRAAELLRKRKSRREILNDLSAKGIDRVAEPAPGQSGGDLVALARSQLGGVLPLHHCPGSGEFRVFAVVVLGKQFLHHLGGGVAVDTFCRQIV